MNSFKYLIALFSIVFLLSSCEEVIELNLDTAAEKYVIEANLTDHANGARVLISKTKSYSSSNDFAGVSGAVVEIEDQLGNITRLDESAKKGVYLHSTLRGTPTQTYKLKIAVGGQTFTSTCIMPAVVPLEDVYPYELNLFDGPRLFTHVKYTDPIGVKNFYRFIEYKNGVYTKSIMATNDEFTDGKTVNQTIFPYEFDDESKLKKGDRIKLEFLTIDEPVYKYWFSVDNGAQGGGDSAAPANPVTNIKGGAIGYFSAHTIQSKEYTVQ
ncbi:DUF4249 domain-containing protein [Pedobacter xixiisoli]|uniref:DUF4249 domain-containing protein n=1 Tax=Pedobacter xixiisoli TaxID=1476464 RepID=A0A286AD34_9SPHI|nr:DUF4249 domain-containing protein [Pedobacter xixiisoli]SOD19814.1 protein of unknown function [Pedobacter xixiisoli]